MDEREVLQFVRNLLKARTTGQHCTRERVFGRARKLCRAIGLTSAEFKQKVLPVLHLECERTEGLRQPNRPEIPRDRKDYNYFSHVQRRYGLSRTEFLRILTGQGSRCAICNGELVLFGENPPCVDHDHSSGKVRGLLCRACNSKLPTQSEPSEAAAHDAYLMRHTPG